MIKQLTVTVSLPRCKEIQKDSLMVKRDYRQHVSKTKSSSKKPRAHQLTEWMIPRFSCKCSLTSASHWGFPVAQMVEHGASNAKIMGSILRESKSWSKCKTVTWMQCKSLWIKASAKCINVNVNVTGGRYLLWLQLLYCTSWTHAVSCRQLWIGEKRQCICCRFLLAHAPPFVSLLIFSDHTFICMKDAFTHEKSSEHSCVLYWRRVPWGFCLLFIPSYFS